MWEIDTNLPNTQGHKPSSPKNVFLLEEGEGHFSRIYRSHKFSRYSVPGFMVSLVSSWGQVWAGQEVTGGLWTMVCHDSLVIGQHLFGNEMTMMLLNVGL